MHKHIHHSVAQKDLLGLQGQALKRAVVTNPVCVCVCVLVCDERERQRDKGVQFTVYASQRVCLNAQT